MMDPEMALEYRKMYPCEDPWKEVAYRLIAMPIVLFMLGVLGALWDLFTKHLALMMMFFLAALVLFFIVCVLIFMYHFLTKKFRLLLEPHKPGSVVQLLLVEEGMGAIYCSASLVSALVIRDFLLATYNYASTRYEAMFVILIIILLSLRYFIVWFRVRNDYFGKNPYEARQLLTFMLKKVEKRGDRGINDDFPPKVFDEFAAITAAQDVHAVGEALNEL